MLGYTETRATTPRSGLSRFVIKNNNDLFYFAYALSGTQFACFAGTKVQILTQMARIADDNGQRTVSAYVSLGVRIQGRARPLDCRHTGVCV
jgi:hypothetical protein